MAQRYFIKKRTPGLHEQGRVFLHIRKRHPYDTSMAFVTFSFSSVFGILTITMPKTEPKEKVTKAIEVS